MSDTDSATLYQRLGGYDAIAAVSDNLLPRLMGDPLLERFWKHRGDDGLAREKQLLINFLCNVSGGPMVYVGRDMTTAHRGMGITTDDWNNFITHLQATLDHFSVPDTERQEVLAFVESTRNEIIDP